MGDSLNNSLLLVTSDVNVVNLVHQIIKNYKLDFAVEIYDKSNLRDDDLNAVAVLLDLDNMTELEKIGVTNKYTLETPLIVLNSSYNDHEMRSLFKNGIYDCLIKPLDEEIVYRLLLKFEAEQSNHTWKTKNDYPQNIMSSLRVNLIYNLLYGNIVNLKEVQDQSQLIGLSSVPNTALAVQIDEFFLINKHKSKEWQDSIRNEIITVYRQFLKELQHEVLAMGTGFDSFAILLSLPLKNNKEEYKKLGKTLAEEARVHIKVNTGYSVTIGIGNFYEDVMDLHTSYQEALYAHKYKFFTGSGEGMVIHIDDVEPFSTEVALVLNQDVSSLVNKLTVADIEGAKENIASLFNYLFSIQKVDPEVLKLQILEISTTFARAAINAGANPKETYSILHEYTTNLHTIENFTQMKNWLEDLIKHLIEMVNNNNNEFTLKSVQEAMKYINKHYSEEITLEKVSKHVYLSTTYLSRIFKRITGTNFIEYVTNLRIEKAKSLLMNLDYTVYQVASEVGYTNSHYFSRVFKSMVGKTPSEYRNSPTDTSVQETPK